MAELTPEIAERQFNKFVICYNELRKTNFVWDCINPKENDDWDFKGYDKNTGEHLNVQYTEAIINQAMKGKLEAQKRREYVFEFAIGEKYSTKAVEDAYSKKLKKADKDIVLLVGFHDFPYVRNRKFDGIKEIKDYTRNNFKSCAFKELWIVNKDNYSCDFIF